MTWGVDFTAEAQRWFAGLTPLERTKFARRLDQLQLGGPALGRPAVDSVHGSRHPNMKELRLANSGTRALFGFGPDRRAIILVGGSKAGQEKRWYRQQLRTADRLFDAHLKTFERGSACRATRAGSRSAERQI